MRYRKGERVVHPRQSDWGVGKVLAPSNSESVRVFFVGVGEKTLSLKYVQPLKVSGEAAAHPVLDNLKLSGPGKSIKYQSLEHSIEFFLESFPEGFHGSKFGELERDYKQQAHELGETLLGQQTFKALLAGGDYAELAKRALRLANATNLIFPNEKMALKDGLKAEGAEQAFAKALYSLLYAKGELEARFVAFVKILEEIGAAKWTIATYYLFILRPAEYMFVKPTITQHAAAVCGFEINYKPQLNWLTYQTVLSFSAYLREELAALRPRDMIDVQSFMWCIAPSTYTNA